MPSNKFSRIQFHNLCSKVKWERLYETRARCQKESGSGTHATEYCTCKLQAGSKDFNSKLETFTLERFKEDFQTCKEFSLKCDELLSRERTEMERLNLSLLKAELDTFICGHEFKGFMFPINYIEGLHTDFARLAGWVSPTRAEDFQEIVERLRGFEAQADQVVGVMRAAVSEGRTLHRVSLVRC